MRTGGARSSLVVAEADANANDSIQPFERRCRARRGPTAVDALYCMLPSRATERGGGDDEQRERGGDARRQAPARAEGAPAAGVRVGVGGRRRLLRGLRRGLREILRRGRGGRQRRQRERER